MAGTNASGRWTSGGAVLVRSAVAVCVLLASSPVPAATLVSWDIPTTTAASAPVFGTAASGLTVSSITAGTLTNLSSSSGWRWVNLLNSSTVDPANMTNSAFTWTFTTSPRTTGTITQITGGTMQPQGTGWPTSLQLWAQAVTASSTSSWTQVGSSLATSGSAANVSMDSAFFSAGSPYNVPAGTQVTFKLVPLGATGGAASPKEMWVSTSTVQADVSLIGTTGGGAWNMYWNGGASGSWNYSATNWLKDNTGSGQAFVAGDNATIANDTAAISVDAGGVTAGSVTVSNTTGTVTLSGGTLAATSLTKTGGGTLVLAAANSFVSGATISGGVVQVGNAGALGSNAATINGATLRSTVSSISSPIAIGVSGATVDNNADLTLAGAITGSANTLTKTGNGTLTLSAAVGTNKSGILLNVSSGSLALTGAAKEFGLGTSTLGVNASATNTVINLDGSAILSGSGVLTVDSGTIATVFGAGSGGSASINNSISFANTVALTAASGKNLKLNGQLIGSGTLNASGSGQVQLNYADAPSTYSGAITSSGNLFATAQAIAAVSSVTQSSGTLTLDNKLVNAGAVVGANISGAGSMDKTSDGNVVLTGNNSFSGGMTITGSALVYVNAASGLGNGTITGSGTTGGSGIGIYAGGSTTSLSIGNAINTGIGTTTGTDGSIIGRTAMNFVPGSGKTITLTGAVSGSGALNLASSGTLVLGNTGTFGHVGGTNVSAGTLVVNGLVSGTAATAVALNAILGGTGSLAGAITFAAGSQFLFNAAGPLTVPGSVSFADASSFGIDDIVGLDSSVAQGTYSLLSGTVNTTGLANLGASNAYSLGNGKTAYFQSSGGLQAVVVPEPATLSLLSGVALASLLVRIRRSRRGS